MAAVSARETTEKRPTAVPRGLWQWSQTWRDVLFLHWPAPHDWLRRQLPKALEIDNFAGEAWVSFVGFRLQVRLRNCPHVPLLSHCVELNFRTYVRYRGEPGIYFLTMHADSRSIVTAARLTTPLPYNLADLRYPLRDGMGQLRSVVRGRLALDAVFSVAGGLEAARPDSLEYFLAERYVAFVGHRASVYRMAVQHPPWQLCPVNLRACRQGYRELPKLPALVQYSPVVPALLWPIERVESR